MARKQRNKGKRRRTGKMRITMSPKGREREIATAEYVLISMHVLESNVQIEYISLVVNDRSARNTFPGIAMV